MAWHQTTRQRRALPDFLILGAQKAGTTSLYRYLIDHPSVDPPVKKEINFFDSKFDRSDDWYRSQFPIRRPGRFTGEATPQYLFRPDVPARVHRLLPEARLIVLIRHPAERAFSEWRMEVRRGWEPLPFEAALLAERRRLSYGFDALQNGRVPDEQFKRASYVERGRYAAQLERWFEYFDPEQILVMRIEDFSQAPEHGFLRILEHIGLGVPAELPPFDIHHQGQPGDLPPKARAHIARELAKDNARLADLIGINYVLDG